MASNETHPSVTEAKKGFSIDLALIIKIAFNSQMFFCVAGVLLNFVLVFVLIKMILNRNYCPSFHPSHFLVVAISDVLVLVGKLLDMYGIWREIFPDPYQDVWLYILVPSSLCVTATMFVFSVAPLFKSWCRSQGKGDFSVPSSNHLCLLTYIGTGILLPGGLYICHHFYGELHQEEDEFQSLGISRRAMALLCLLAMVSASFSFVVNFIAVLTGLRGRQRSASKPLYNVVTALALLFVVTHMPWLLYNDQDVTDVCQFDGLDNYDTTDEYYDNFDFVTKCSQKMDSFVDWGITFNAVGKLMFFCCFGGVNFRQIVCHFCPCCFWHNCCGCLVCKRRIRSMTSITKEGNLYICANQFPESHQSLNCAKQEPNGKAGIEVSETLSF